MSVPRPPGVCPSHCRPCSGAVAWPPLAAGPAAPSAQSQLEHAVAGGTPGDRPLPLYGLWRDRRVPFEEVEVWASAGMPEEGGAVAYVPGKTV